MFTEVCLLLLFKWLRQTFLETLGNFDITEVFKDCRSPVMFHNPVHWATLATYSVTRWASNGFTISVQTFAKSKQNKYLVANIHFCTNRE